MCSFNRRPWPDVSIRITHGDAELLDELRILQTALAFDDMTKAVDRELRIEGIRLVEKTKTAV